jgi:hypothetical protein
MKRSMPTVDGGGALQRFAGFSQQPSDRPCKASAAAAVLLSATASSLFTGVAPPQKDAHYASTPNGAAAASARKKRLPRQQSFTQSRHQQRVHALPPAFVHACRRM